MKKIPQNNIYNWNGNIVINNETDDHLENNIIKHKDITIIEDCSKNNDENTTIKWESVYETFIESYNEDIAKLFTIEKNENINKIPRDNDGEYPYIKKLNEEIEEKFKKHEEEIIKEDKINEENWNRFIRWLYTIYRYLFWAYLWILRIKFPRLTCNGITVFENAPTLYAVASASVTLPWYGYISIGTPAACIYVIRRIMYMRASANVKWYYKINYEIWRKMLIRGGLNRGYLEILDIIAIKISRLLRWL